MSMASTTYYLWSMIKTTSLEPSRAQMLGSGESCPAAEKWNLYYQALREMGFHTVYERHMKSGCHPLNILSLIDQPGNSLSLRLSANSLRSDLPPSSTICWPPISFADYLELEWY